MNYLSPQCEGDPPTPNKVILPHSTPDESCFVFMLCYSYSFIYPYLTASINYKMHGIDYKMHGIGEKWQVTFLFTNVLIIWHLPRLNTP